MNEQDDHIETGSIQPLPNGFYRDIATGVVFYFNKEGKAVNVHGQKVLPDDDDFKDDEDNHDS